MANIKQQIKRNRTNKERNLANASYKSKLKTTFKNVNAAVQANDLQRAEESLSIAYKTLDKALSKGIVHQNYVNRNKASLAALVNGLK